MSKTMSNKPTKIETVRDAVDAMGGMGRVSQISGVSQSAPHNWRADDRLPAKYFLLHTEDIRDRCGRSIEINPDVWGMIRRDSEQYPVPSWKWRNILPRGKDPRYDKRTEHPVPEDAD